MNLPEMDSKVVVSLLTPLSLLFPPLNDLLSTNEFNWNNNSSPPINSAPSSMLPSALASPSKKPVDRKDSELSSMLKEQFDLKDSELSST